MMVHIKQMILPVLVEGIGQKYIARWCHAALFLGFHSHFVKIWNIFDHFLRYQAGKCATGIAIPIWTSETIDEFIDKWAKGPNFLTLIFQDFPNFRLKRFDHFYSNPFWVQNVAFNRDYEEFTKSNVIHVEPYKKVAKFLIFLLFKTYFFYNFLFENIFYDELYQSDVSSITALKLVRPHF